MPAINRNITRTIKNTTETTIETQSPSATTLAFNLQTTDNFYIGFKKPFTTRYFCLDTVNATTSIVSIAYWDGDSFEAVEDVIDQTIGFTESGFISWENKTDWRVVAQPGVADVELFWIRLTVSVNLDSGTLLQSVLNLFNDDVMLRQYYPELLSDARWLPPGRTTFIDQFLAAKNLVVQRLKRDQIIDDESQIIDINEVAIAAVYASAHIIFNPISPDEVDRERSKDAKDLMNSELNGVRLDLDLDDTGTIDEGEKDVGNIVFTRG